MAKIKYIEGKKYTLKLWGTEIKDVTYDGVYEDYDCSCDLCGRNVWNPHFFIEYNKDGTMSNSYHIGSECVKKVVQPE